MTVAAGDPASISAGARTAREVARRLEPVADGLRRAADDVADGWTGRTSVETRRSAADLADAASALVAELDRVGQVLQDHATDLADLVARERVIGERATSAGLTVHDGRVEPAPGIWGDAGRAAEREATRVVLQSDLDLVAAQHARRRDFLLGLVGGSTATLAGVSRGLHRQ